MKMMRDLLDELDTFSGDSANEAGDIGESILAAEKDGDVTGNLFNGIARSSSAAITRYNAKRVDSVKQERSMRKR